MNSQAENRYAELEVNLRRRSEQGYSVEMWLSTSDSDADTLLTRDGAGTFQFDETALVTVDPHPKAYGAVLSTAFFQDPKVRQAFAEARAAGASGLRVRFFIDADASKLHALRWETLADPDTLDDLNKLADLKTLNDPKKWSPLLTGETHLFSRYLSSGDRRRVPLRPKSDLRALVVVANPDGLERYGLTRVNVDDDENGEVPRARAALKGIDVLELASRGSATLNNLIAHLRRSGSQRPPDILYLVAHGKLDSGGRPLLFLEKDTCQVDVVQGEEFVRRLSELVEPPRLVVLASCQSGGTGDTATSADMGVLSALGPRMAAAGIAAVVAMQGNVTMKTVAQFMPVFFAQLKEHGQIDRAVAVARSSVFRERPLDWWAPALFMRLKSGRIWQLYDPGFSQELKQWPALLRAIQYDKCTPVIGPGIYDSLLGSRRDMARRWAQAEGFPLAPESVEDLPQVAQFLAVEQDRFYVQTELETHLKNELWGAFGHKLRSELQSASLDELIKEAARVADPADDSPYRVLARLPLSIFITANPGDLLGDALRAQGKDPQVEICRWNDSMDDLPSIFDDKETYYKPSVERPLVYHLFGRISEPDSLVLTEDDYLLWLIGVTANKERIPVVVRDALAGTGLLFLGFAIDDWDFRMLLRYIMSQQGRAAGSKFSNIAAQINLQEGRALAPERAQSYLEDYFQDQKISIFWGSADDFARQLARRLPVQVPQPVRA